MELGIKVKIQEGMREQVELYNALLEDVAKLRAWGGS
jgi:hypothetical protein